MRLFWTVVLAGGLLLTGFDLYGSRRERESRRDPSAPEVRMPTPVAEDGTGFPKPPQ